MSTGRRSHWCWGWEEAFPSREERNALGREVARWLGVAVHAPREAVPITDVPIRPSRITAPDGWGPSASSSHEDRIRHTYGRSFPDQCRAFHGQFTHCPDVVLAPRDEEGVRRALDWAHHAGVPLVPYGGGTSVVGGVTPDVKDAPAYAVLTMTHLDRLLSLDPTSRLAHFQAGILGPAIEDALRPHGYTLRHFPQSFEFSSLGGWLATRNGGHYATGYTHIDDLAASIRIEAPAGQIDTPLLPGNGAGPEPKALFLGSEGAFGVITQAWMRIRPRPRFRAHGVLAFSSFEEGAAACRQIVQAGWMPASCRLLDPFECFMHRVARDGRARLLLGFEGHATALQSDYLNAEAVAIAAGGARADEPQFLDEGDKARRQDDAGAWRGAFLRAPYLQGALLSVGVLCDTFETSCTWERFPALDRAVREALCAAAAAEGQTVGISCRFTHVYPDGPAPYYTFLTAAADDCDATVDRWWRLKRAATDALIKEGGALSHHHAVGRLHRPWYEDHVGHTFAAALAGAKRSLDPRGIMNPGVFTPPTSG